MYQNFNIFERTYICMHNATRNIFAVLTLLIGLDQGYAYFTAVSEFVESNKFKIEEQIINAYKKSWEAQLPKTLVRNFIYIYFCHIAQSFFIAPATN